MRERYIYVYRVSSINQGFSKKKKKKKYKPRDIQKRSHEGLQETKKVSFWSGTQLLLLANISCVKGAAPTFHMSHKLNWQTTPTLPTFTYLLFSPNLKLSQKPKIFSVFCLNFLSESISYDVCNER